MDWVGIGVHKTHRDCLNSGFFKDLQCIDDIFLLHRCENFAVSADPFSDWDPIPSANQWRWLFPEEVVHHRSISAANLKCVAKTNRAKKAAFGACSRQECVQTDRRAVHE